MKKGISYTLLLLFLVIIIFISFGTTTYSKGCGNDSCVPFMDAYPDNLLRWYRMNESGAVGTLVDYSPTGHDLTVCNGVLGDAADPFDVTKTTLNFGTLLDGGPYCKASDTVNDLFSVPQTTVCGWFMTHYASDGKEQQWWRGASGVDNPSFDWVARVNAANYDLSLSIQGVSFNFAINMALNEWNFFCWQRNGTAGYYWLNGDLIHTGTTSAASSTTTSLQINVQYQSGTSYNNFPGNRSDNSFWNETLTTAGILCLYNGTGCFSPAPTDLVTDIIIANNSYDSHSINFTSDGGQSCGLNTSNAATLCGPTLDTTPTIRAKPVTGTGSFRMFDYKGTYYNFTTLGTSVANYTNCTVTGGEATCIVGWDLPEGISTLAITGQSEDFEQNSIETHRANQFNISINSPPNPSSFLTPINETYSGFLNISWNACTDPDGDDVTYRNLTIFNSDVKEGICYQETATNITICGGLDTGNYIRDGQIAEGFDFHDENYSSFSHSTSGNKHMYVWYTLPDREIISAIWQIKDGDNVRNITVPPGCLNRNNVNLSFTITSHDTTQDVTWRCKNSTSIPGEDGQILSFSTTNDRVYEEAIFWNLSRILLLSSTNETYYNWNTTEVSDGTYDLNLKCCDTSGACSNFNQSTSFGNFTIFNDLCAYISGDYNVNCANQCSVNSPIDLSGNNLILEGKGNFTVSSRIENVRNITIADICNFVVKKGSNMTVITN